MNYCKKRCKHIIVIQHSEECHNVIQWMNDDITTNRKSKATPFQENKTMHTYPQSYAMNKYQQKHITQNTYKFQTWKLIFTYE